MLRFATICGALIFSNLPANISSRFREFLKVLSFLNAKKLNQHTFVYFTNRHYAKK